MSFCDGLENEHKNLLPHKATCIVGTIWSTWVNKTFCVTFSNIDIYISIRIHISQYRNISITVFLIDMFNEDQFRFFFCTFSAK